MAPSSNYNTDVKQSGILRYNWVIEKNMEKETIYLVKREKIHTNIINRYGNTDLEERDAERDEMEIYSMCWNIILKLKYDFIT